MRFGVLGRLEVRRPDGAEVPISGRARRQLLAALLCRAGSPVSAATLIDDLWGAAAPRTALGTLRSHMTRLRDDLGREDADDLVRTEGDGYRLRVAPDDLDASRFERLAAAAAALTDPSAAIARYDEALALWRDDAYIEFGDAPFAVGERIRLAELRSLARERRTDLRLASGLAAELIADLEQVVRAEPYRERGWEQLALALYRCGRQADALQACRRARDLLAEDLGVDPGEGLRRLEERFLRQDPDLLRATPAAVTAPALDRCPYLGLAGYDEQDAALFVGRERLTSILAGRLADQSVVVVTGASGVGKSSLIRAGLVPALRAGALPGSAAWRIDVCAPADGMSVGDESARVPDLLVLDQSEELFTSIGPDARDEIVRRLSRYVDERGGRVVLVLRSDFYGRLADVDVLAPFAEKTAVLVGAMRADELRRAIVEPAATAGLRLEPDLVETIMEDVAGQPEPLPLLSEAMVRTWERRDGDLLTLEGYRAGGEVAGALQAAAEDCYARLGSAERQAARHLLVRMAARTETGWIRRPLPRAGFHPSAEQDTALSALLSARLVVASADRVEMAHDALLSHWPRLRDWLAERALAADLLAHLDQAVTTWDGAGRQEVDLYRGPRLSAALDWRAEHPEDLAPAEHEFLDTSARAAEAELAAARAQALREARGRRNLRRIAIGLTAAAVLAVFGGVVAVHERGTARAEAVRARQAATVADARRVAALALTAPDLATSSALAVAAWRVDDSPDTRNALLTILERNNAAMWRLPFQLRLLRLDISADGRTAWLMDRDRSIHIVDLRRRKQVGEFRLPADDVAGLTPDGRTLIVFGAEHGNDPNGAGRVTALDARTGAVRYVFPFRGQDPSPGSVAPVLTGDGHWLAIPGGADPRRRRTIAVFDARDWKGRPRLLSLPAPVAALAAGRSALAVQTADHQVRLVQPPGLRTTWTGRITDGDLVALSSDGRRMAVGGPSLRLVSAGPASSTGQATIGGSDFSAVQFSPDGAELVVGTNAGSLGIYAAATGERLATLPGSAGAVVASAWARTADGEALYTAGLDSELVRWDVTGDARIRSDIPGSTLPPPNDTGQYGNTVVGDGPIEDGTYSNAGGPGERAWVLDLRSRRMRTWPLGLSRGSYVFGASATTDGELGLFTIWEQKSNRSQAWIVDLRTGHRIGRLALPPASNGYSGYSGVIAPNHKFAVESIGYNVLGIFAVPSGRLLHQYYVQFRDQPPNRFEIYPSKFDPRGGVLIYAIDDGPPAPPPPGSRQPAPTDTAPKSSRIGLLDPATGRLTAQGAVGPESITAVGWSHNKRLLAIGTVGGILQLYDARTLRRITDAGVVEGGYILTASFSPDDRTLVTGSTGDASLWSVPTLTRIGGPLLSAPDENGWWYAWFRTDGNIEGIAPTESSGLPRDTLFTVPGHPPDWAARACALAGATLSRPQWRRYFGTAPYQDTCPTR